jgi:hypothetical protein
MIPGQQRRLTTKLATKPRTNLATNSTPAEVAAVSGKSLGKSPAQKHKLVDSSQNKQAQRLARKRAQLAAGKLASSRQHNTTRLMHHWPTPNISFAWLLLGGFIVLLTCLSIACIHNVNTLSNKLDVIVAALSRA